MTTIDPGLTSDSTVEAINAGLQSLKSGSGTLGKVAVIVDRDLAAGKSTQKRGACDATV